MADSKLTESTLSEVCTLVTDGTHDTPKIVSEGVPLIKAKEIVGGIIDFDSCDNVAEEDHKKIISRSKPEYGDTLFAHIGASLGEAAYINTRKEFSIKNVALFKPDPKKIDGRYLNYIVKSPQFQELAKRNRTGSAQPFLSLSHLRDHKIRYHEDLDTQQEIASTLSVFDDLIENNSRRIEILEEMARRIYREWFVHFRYPGHEDDELVDSGTELGEIPEGWEFKKVDDIVNRLSKGNIYRKKNTDEEGDIIIIDQSTDEYLGFHDNEPDFPASPDKPFIIFGDHTCKMQLLIRPFSLGPNVVPFIAEEEELSNYYLYYLLEPIIESREYKRHWTTFKVKKVAVASNELAKRFEEKVRPLIEQKENLKKQVNKLKETRDLLLPKLISGRIDVKEVTV